MKIFFSTREFGLSAARIYGKLNFIAHTGENLSGIARGLGLNLHASAASAKAKFSGAKAVGSGVKFEFKFTRFHAKAADLKEVVRGFSAGSFKAAFGAGGLQ